MRQFNCERKIQQFAWWKREITFRGITIHLHIEIVENRSQQGSTRNWLLEQFLEMIAKVIYSNPSIWPQSEKNDETFLWASPWNLFQNQLRLEFSNLTGESWIGFLLPMHLRMFIDAHKLCNGFVRLSPNSLPPFHENVLCSTLWLSPSIATANNQFAMYINCKTKNSQPINSACAIILCFVLRKMSQMTSVLFLGALPTHTCAQKAVETKKNRH